ncbi:HD domain-containing protein [Tissierella praeacuta]|uniref:CCA tRNA nucleotidyltransferase n=1 Tax=Tissierella praeacuta TaxID=43131 RepID=UPI0033425961
MVFNIPRYVELIIDRLEEEGFSAYIVGGSVRDLLIGREPSDFDITTDALPEEIENIFSDFITLEVGKKFGTIVIVQDEGIVEVTTFRTDGEYIDGRRPEKVYFSKNIFDDLSRRDFTINAMAYNKNIGIVDHFNGIKDLDRKIIKAVGKPQDRFKEDYLRIMRAIRFATQLQFSIDKETFNACKLYSEHISEISIERIREEFFKTILSERPSYGIRMMKDIKILNIILPELMKTIGFNQHNPHHDKDVFEHIMCVLDKTSPILHLRLGALFHDIGKPSTLIIDENGVGHFYGHEKSGAKMAKEILKRWKASNDIIDKVVMLIDKHMTQHSDLKEKGLKRLLSNFGEDDIFTLLELQKADRSCSNKEADIKDLLEREKKIKDIIRNKEVYEKNQLAINGSDVIKLGYKEGKIIGGILNYLFEKVLENPELNEREQLIDIVKEQFKIDSFG